MKENNATKLWFNEWVKQGKKDEGTCCVGKCLRDRKTDRVLASSPPVQGNMSAFYSRKPAVAHLMAQGYDVYYDDGRMD